MRLVLFAKTGDTYLRWKDELQPPVFARRGQHIISPKNVDETLDLKGRPSRKLIGMIRRRYPPNRHAKPQVFLLVLS